MSRGHEKETPVAARVARQIVRRLIELGGNEVQSGRRRTAARGSGAAPCSLHYMVLIDNRKFNCRVGHHVRDADQVSPAANGMRS